MAKNFKKSVQNIWKIELCVSIFADPKRQRWWDCKVDRLGLWDYFEG
jgi:hypothetical protein